MPVKGDKKFDQTEVLERAMSLFWKQGYEATGTAQLVKEMGIGRQSIYDTFGSKRELFIVALEHYVNTNARSLISELQGSDQYLNQLKSQFQLWSDFTLVHEEGCFLVNALAELAWHDKEIQAIWIGHMDEVEQRLAETIEAAIKANEIAEDLEVRQTSQALVAMLNGLFLLSKTRPSKSMVKSVIKSAEKLLT